MTVDPTVECAGDIAALRAESLNRSARETLLQSVQTDYEAFARASESFCIGYSDPFLNQVTRDPYQDFLENFNSGASELLIGILIGELALAEDNCALALGQQLAGAILLERAVVEYEQAIDAEERARSVYASCLRNARLQASRRDGALPAEI